MSLILKNKYCSLDKRSWVLEEGDKAFMSREWEMFLNIARDMEKIAMWEAQKAEDQKDPRKEQVNGGGERRGRRSEGGKWTTICGKRKPSKS